VNLIPAYIHRRIAHRPNLVKIVDNIGWLFFDKLLRMGVGLLVGVWIARYLGPEQFGLLNFATAFIGLFGAIAGLGLQGIVVRDIVRDPKGKEETLGTAAALQFIGGLIAYGLILVTIFWLRPDDVLAKTLVAILGSMMLFKASEGAMYWFESQVLSKYTVWVQNGSFLVFAAIKVVLILNNAPLIAFAWATMAEALVVAVLMLLMLGFRGLQLNQLRTTMSRAKTLLADSWPLILSGIAVMIYMKIDQIMLGQMIGDEVVGIYSAGVRISEVWYFIPMSIAASVFPSIIENRKNNISTYNQRVQKLYDLMVMLALAIAIPTTIMSEEIVTLLFGLEYIQAAPVLSISIWAGVGVAMSAVHGKWLLAEGLQNYVFVYTISGAVINTVLNYFLIPQHGAIGAAWATLCAQFAPILIQVLIPKARPNFAMMIRGLAAPFRYIFIWRV
jgi:O-antigen/teichoic acid export membrane protein